MNKWLLILGIGFLLVGCGDDKIEISKKPIDIQIAKPADPPAVKMIPVTFRVVTKETLDGFIADITKSQNDANPVFVAVSLKDYENMSLNLADLRRYVEQQREIIIYYKKVTDSIQPPTKDAN